MWTGFRLTGLYGSIGDVDHCNLIEGQVLTSSDPSVVSIIVVPVTPYSSPIGTIVAQAQITAVGIGVASVNSNVFIDHEFWPTTYNVTSGGTGGGTGAGGATGGPGGPGITVTGSAQFQRSGNGGVQKTRPKSRREFMQSLKEPYAQPIPDPVFTEPQKLGQPEVNRALEYSLKKDEDKVFSVGIKDIDEAVMYYFNQVLKPHVVQNNTRVNVPVIYGTPENWKGVQADGYYRDQRSKIIAPLIMFKRNSVTQNRTLGNKLDGNKAHNLQFFQKKYSKRNIYSNFAALNSRSPETEYLVSITPDYVTVEYTCLVWTYFVEQMDSLIESFNFASRSYWGDPNRFLFYSNIESFTDTLSYEIGEDRLVRNSFNLTINGYLIPDTEMSKIAGASKSYGISRVIFGLETTSGTETATTAAKAKASAPKSVLINDSVNNVYNVNAGGVDQNTLTYLSTNKQVIGSYSSPTTATFNNGWLTAPTGLPATSKDSFTFFVNGSFVDKAAVVSFTQSGGVSTLEINPTILEYSLDAGDYIVAIGKFS